MRRKKQVPEMLKEKISPALFEFKRFPNPTVQNEIFTRGQKKKQEA